MTLYEKIASFFFIAEFHCMLFSFTLPFRLLFFFFHQFISQYQSNRFNLAKVDYHPALRTVNLRATSTLLANNIPRYEWPFAREGNTLGGELLHDSYVVNEGRTFYVDRDIYVHPNKVQFQEIPLVMLVSIVLLLSVVTLVSIISASNLPHFCGNPQFLFSLEISVLGFPTSGI